MDGFRCPSPKGVLTKQDPAMFAVVLSLLLSVPWASAVRWSPQSFPNPLHDVNSCGRYGKPSWICDPDHILSEYNQDLVEGSIHEIAEGPYKTAHCSAGYQVAVALVRDMYLQNGRTAAEQAEFFAKFLHRSWGVGDVSCNNGLVFFLSVNSRQMYLAVDPQVLSRQRQQYVLNRAKDKMRSGDLDGGIEGAIIDIGLALSGADLPHDSHADEQWDLIIVVLIIVIIFCILCWVSYKDRCEASKCQSMLQKLKTEQAAAVQAQRYPAMSCPICFEDLEQGDGLPDVPSSVADLEAGMAGANGTHFSRKAEASGYASSSKVDNTPSAPPLDSHPERESLLSNDMRMLSKSLDEHKPGRDAAGKQLKPMWLSCGHAFCQDCIASWLQDKDSCPICRQPVAATRPDPVQHSNLTRGASLPRPNVGLNQQHHDWDTDMYALEIKFRLARLQVRYPQYVNNDMVSNWASHTSSGQVVNWDAARDMQLNNPAVRQSRHDRGSHGATTNFGGGGGRYGGGGSGASW
ncbi:TPA: hypothetical protein ACH3X2_008143 [Trebouxia sp. C0005]